MTQERIPVLLDLMFGEAAGAALQGASPRLLAWCSGMERWLAERGEHYLGCTVLRTIQAWRKLSDHLHKMPWDLTAANIEDHKRWMQKHGYTNNVIGTELYNLRLFFRWCAENQVDPLCPPDFNPLAQVKIPQVAERYAHIQLWSMGEQQALLEVMRQDTSPLGLRDTAFVLLRLQVGVRLAPLRRLRWGQLAPEGDGATITWGPGAVDRIPAEVWEAIQAYLHASGRAAGMRAESYLFVPSKNMLHGQPPHMPEAWQEGRCISLQLISFMLKRYGRSAGIADHKVTTEALRLTAARRLKDEVEAAGCSTSIPMQFFLHNHTAPSVFNKRLQDLPQLPEAAPAAELKFPLPDRTSHMFKAEEVTSHGFYARSQPVEEVQAILAEGVEGMEAETAKLRLLMRGLQERMQTAEGKELARLADATAAAAGRVGAMLDAARRIRMKEIREKNTQLWEEAPAAGEPALALTSPYPVEEVASIRLVLRKLFRLAQAESENMGYAYLVDLYSKACFQLMKALEREGGTAELRKAEEQLEFDEILAEVMDEMRLK